MDRAEQPRKPDVFSEPMKVEIAGGVIVVLAGSEALAITPEAAEESARRLLDAVTRLRR